MYCVSRWSQQRCRRRSKNNTLQLCKAEQDNKAHERRSPEIPFASKWLWNSRTVSTSTTLRATQHAMAMKSVLTMAMKSEDCGKRDEDCGLTSHSSVMKFVQRFFHALERRHRVVFVGRSFSPKNSDSWSDRCKRWAGATKSVKWFGLRPYINIINIHHHHHHPSEILASESYPS